MSERNKTIVRQASYRPGVIGLKNKDERVYISGKAKIIIAGKLQV